MIFQIPRASSEEARLNAELNHYVEEIQALSPRFVQIMTHMNDTVVRAVRTGFGRYFKALYDYSNGVYGAYIRNLKGKQLQDATGYQTIERAVGAVVCKANSPGASHIDVGDDGIPINYSDWKPIGAVRLSLTPLFIKYSGPYCFGFRVHDSLKLSLREEDEHKNIQSGWFQAAFSPEVTSLLMKYGKLEDNRPAVYDESTGRKFITADEAVEIITWLKDSADMMRQLVEIPISTKSFRLVFHYSAFDKDSDKDSDKGPIKVSKKPDDDIRTLGFYNQKYGTMYYLLAALLNDNFFLRKKR